MHQVATQGEEDAPEAKDAFEADELPQIQLGAESGNSIKLPFEPQLAGTDAQLKVSEIHAYYLLDL